MRFHTGTNVINQSESCIAGIPVGDGYHVQTLLQMGAPVFGGPSSKEGGKAGIAYPGEEAISQSNFEIISKDKDEIEKIRSGMQAVEDRITSDMDPVKAAAQMDTDEVVYMGELRRYLRAMVEMSYQAIGYRRVKNPRIWAAHDLHTLTDI